MGYTLNNSTLVMRLILKSENKMPKKRLFGHKLEPQGFFSRTSIFTLKNPLVGFLFCAVCCLIVLLIHQMTLFVRSDFFGKFNTTGLVNPKFISRVANLIENEPYKHDVLPNRSNMGFNNNFSMYFSEQCQTIPDSSKFDCFPQEIISQDKCHSRGCCWALSQNNTDLIPQCFYPAKFRSYSLINLTTSNVGKVAYLQMIKNSTYPKNIPVIKIDFNYWTKDILQVKVSVAYSICSLILG